MKRINKGLQVIAFVLFAVIFLINANAINAQSQSLKVIAEGVKRHIVELGDDKYEGRGAGYPGERKAADYVAKQFEKAGLKPAGTKKFFQEYSFHPISPEKPWDLLSSRNVLGLIEGSDPILKNEIVVIGAHYDGQGKTGQADPGRYRSKSDSALKDDIWNSANDNAASIAAIIEIARAFKQGKITTKRSILIIAFGGEEHGLAGSMYYVSHPIATLNDHIAMINLEKIGLSTGKPFNTSGNANSKQWDEIIQAIQEQTNTKVVMTKPYVIPESDHYPFNGLRIPAIMFYTTGVAAHYPDDHSDKIDFDRVAEAARFVMQMVIALADRPQRPQYVPAPIPDLGLSAHLATDAEANAMGLKAPESGLKVTGIIPGLPAAIGGLRAGDFIIEFANLKFVRGEPLESLQKKHMDILMGKQGNKLQAKVIRNGKVEVLEVMLR